MASSGSRTGLTGDWRLVVTTRRASRSRTRRRWVLVSVLSALSGATGTWGSGVTPTPAGAADPSGWGGDCRVPASVVRTGPLSRGGRDPVYGRNGPPGERAALHPRCTVVTR